MCVESAPPPRGRGRRLPERGRGTQGYSCHRRRRYPTPLILAGRRYGRASRLASRALPRAVCHTCEWLDLLSRYTLLICAPAGVAGVAGDYTPGYPAGVPRGGRRSGTRIHYTMKGGPCFASAFCDCFLFLRLKMRTGGTAISGGAFVSLYNAAAATPGAVVAHIAPHAGRSRGIAAKVSTYRRQGFDVHIDTGSCSAPGARGVAGRRGSALFQARPSACDATEKKGRERRLQYGENEKALSPPPSSARFR